MGNNYYFFCAVKIDKDRNPSINQNPIFKDIREHLMGIQDPKLKMNKASYTLSGVYNLSPEFDIPDYFPKKIAKIHLLKDA